MVLDMISPEEDIWLREDDLVILLACSIEAVVTSVSSKLMDEADIFLR
jgi:hypothetical protein